MLILAFQNFRQKDGGSLFAPPLDVEQGRSLLAPQLLEQLMLAESLAGSCLLRLHLYFVFERFAFMLLFDSRHTTCG